MRLQLITGNDPFMFIDTINSDVDLNCPYLNESPELNEMSSMRCPLCLKVKKPMWFLCLFYFFHFCLSMSTM